MSAPLLPGEAAAGAYPISAVERETGLSKDTLRMWERRYGFPAPGRDAQGERVYPAEQVARLRQLRRLIHAGHRPEMPMPTPRARLLCEPAKRGAAACGSRRMRRPRGRPLGRMP